MEVAEERKGEKEMTKVGEGRRHTWLTHRVMEVAEEKEEREKEMTKVGERRRHTWLTHRVMKVAART